MKKTLVSIIVPVYNAEKYLCRCMESILIQTFTNWECILVDDGSTDQSGKICDEYAAKDSRFKVVHKQNEGVAKARITAFEHSVGNYITFIDADDYVSPKYVKTLYDDLIFNHADVTCCQYYRVEGGKMIAEIREHIGYFDKKGIEDIMKKDFWFDIKTFSSGIPLFLCLKLIKRKLVLGVLQAGLGHWFGEDQLGSLYLMYNISSIYISDEPLYYYVFHRGQTINKIGKKRWDANVDVWEETLLLDSKGYLQNQFPYRVFFVTIGFLNTIVEKRRRYSEFKNNWDYVLSTPILTERCLKVNMKLGYSSKIKLWLLRKRWSFIYFIMIKIAMIVKRMGFVTK